MLESLLLFRHRGPAPAGSSGCCQATQAVWPSLLVGVRRQSLAGDLAVSGAT
jgi:hypothetical protein